MALNGRMPGHDLQRENPGHDHGQELKQDQAVYGPCGPGNDDRTDNIRGEGDCPPFSYPE